MFGFLKQRWFQIFMVGTVLFFGTEQALKFTNNVNFVPTVILLGAFLVPVTFVAYFYGQERALDKKIHVDFPLPIIANSFLVGGVIGSVVAGFLEYATLRTSSVFNVAGVAVIEEAAKLIFPVALFIHGRYRSEADGLLFGITSGMGFAALETMGYGLIALLQSQGSIDALEEVLLVRGLLSPVGHAAWTGLVCAVLWKQRTKTGKSFQPVVLSVFILVVAMHAVWNIVSTFNQVYLIYIGYAVVGSISLTLLISRLRDAKMAGPEKR